MYTIFKNILTKQNIYLLRNADMHTHGKKRDLMKKNKG